MPGTFPGAGHPAISPCFVEHLRVGWGGWVVEEGVVSKPSPRSPSLFNRDSGSHLEEMVIEITE